MSIHGILFSYEKEVTTVNIFCDMDEPHWNNAKGNKPALRCRHPQVKNLCDPVIRLHSEELMKNVGSWATFSRPAPQGLIQCVQGRGQESESSSDSQAEWALPQSSRGGGKAGYRWRSNWTCSSEEGRGLWTGKQSAPCFRLGEKEAQGTLGWGSCLLHDSV